MKSKIRVEFDFDNKEPYLQLYIEDTTDDQPDMRDQMLKAFIEMAGDKGLKITYPEHNPSKSVPQIRLV